MRALAYIVPMPLSAAVGALLVSAYGWPFMPLAFFLGLALGFSGRGITAFADDIRYLREHR